MLRSTAELRTVIDSRMPAALRLLEQMVGINSYTGNKEGVNRLGRFTADAFAALDFTPEFVPSSNPAWGEHLILTRPGRSERSVLMISHLDTVFPPEEEARNQFRWQPEGDRIFGPGTHDIKGGTAMMWLVLESLRAWAPDVFAGTTWKLLWKSSEECISPDFGDVCRRYAGPAPLAALVFEAEGRSPTREGLLVVARKGRATWRVTVSGRGAHAGGKHNHGANAIVQLGRTLQRISALTDYTRDLTFNVATITGGTVLNRVPHEAVAEGEFRAFTPAAFTTAKESLLALGGKGDVCSPADGFACEIKIEVLTQSNPWPRNAATDQLAAVWQQAAAELGQSLGCEARGGLSDGNMTWDFVPTLDGLGPWGDNDHCSERSPDGSKLPEYVELSSFVPKAALNTGAIMEMLETIP